jgi:hypothetical protein
MDNIVDPHQWGDWFKIFNRPISKQLAVGEARSFFVFQFKNNKQKKNNKQTTTNQTNQKTKQNNNKKKRM